MRDRAAVSRMCILFVWYHNILHRQGLSWLPETNLKGTVTTWTRPYVLSYLVSVYNPTLDSCTNPSRGTSVNSWRIPWSCQSVKILDIDPKTRAQAYTDEKKGNPNGLASVKPPGKGRPFVKEEPFYLWEPPPLNSIWQLLKDFMKCPGDENKVSHQQCKREHARPVTDLRSPPEVKSWCIKLPTGARSGKRKGNDGQKGKG